ncbi:MarR family winged helix-turn-helix transcriptional regulator [Qipengyuania sp. MTN3-11]|uniref:MarR family winged helix-turn-helix transcriptional regulator n=1 Tax=Qipengyuania sp. MTN3-11 TaxID=3056557 RepID=UPI0036F227F2
MADETEPASELGDHLGYWLRFVSNHVSAAFARKLDRHGVTVAEWVFLRTLRDHDMLGPSRLSEAMGMSRGAISKLAERLEAKSLVARTDRADDARAHLLSLSPAGRALVPQLARLADENDREFFGDLADSDRATMTHALRSIVAARKLKTLPTS